MKNAKSSSIATRIVRKVRNHLHPSVNISDEYTELLVGVNAGWLDPGNLYAIDYAIKHIPSESPIVEIGSFCGLSTNLISYYKSKHKCSSKLINCDKWEWNNKGLIGDSSFTFSDYLAFALETYKRNVVMFSGFDLPFTIKEFSDDFFNLWRKESTIEDIFGRNIKLGGPISFGFIDGNHDFEFAKRDFVNVDEFLNTGGFILFDDSADGTTWDVARVRDEVIATKRYEVVMKNPNYLFRKK